MVAADAGARVDERTVRGVPVVRLDAVEGSAGYLVGIADPQVRARVSASLDERGAVAVTLVHPTAVVGPETSFGSGQPGHGQRARLQ